MKPEDKINLVDLMRYAIRKRYIKTDCSMEASDCMRKLTQRVLSKMFPNANIFKNRNRQAYNVSFVPNSREFRGDYTNYMHNQEQQIFPDHIGQYSRAISIILEYAPQVIPYLLIVQKGDLQGHWDSRDGGTTFKIPQESIDLITSQMNKGGEYYAFNPINMSECLKLLVEFSSSYRGDGEDGNHIALATYGFTVAYAHRNRSQSRNAPPDEIDRPFIINGPLLAHLETLTQACKIYRKLRTDFDAQLRFIIRCRSDGFIQRMDSLLRSREDAGESLEFITKNIHREINKYFKILPAKDSLPPIKKPEPQPLAAPEKPARTVIVGTNVYNADKIQDDFNDWLKSLNREEHGN